TLLYLRLINLSVILLPY
ncbi:MAG: hypothetical protein SPLM_06290, partial [Spiroplasma phoeniceum]